MMMIRLWFGFHRRCRAFRLITLGVSFILKKKIDSKWAREAAPAAFFGASSGCWSWSSSPSPWPDSAPAGTSCSSPSASASKDARQVQFCWLTQLRDSLIHSRAGWARESKSSFEEIRNKRSHSWLCSILNRVVVKSNLLAHFGCFGYSWATDGKETHLIFAFVFPPQPIMEILLKGVMVPKLAASGMMSGKSFSEAA